MDPFFVSSPDKPTALPVAPITIHDRPAGPIAPALPTASAQYLERYANAARNSRLSSPLNHRLWSLRWKVDVATDLKPASVVEGGDRILIYGADKWQLLDEPGQSLADGTLGASGVFLDPAHGLFYFADDLGFISARRFADGSDAFSIPAMFTTNVQRTLISRQGRRLWVGSVERRQMTRADYKPNLSVIELQDLGETLHADHGILDSAKQLRKQLRCNLLTLTALYKDNLVAVTENNVYVFDPDLNIRTVLRGAFHPVAFSLDEAGRIYLLADGLKGSALSILTQLGERIATVALPAGFKSPSAPPIISYSHRVYLIDGRRILAADIDGKLAWDRTTDEEIIGGVVTVDNQLLVSSATSITSWGPDGSSEVLYKSSDDAFQTTPILTVHGNLLVASRGSLYCLEPH